MSCTRNPLRIGMSSRCRLSQIPPLDTDTLALIADALRGDDRRAFACASKQTGLAVAHSDAGLVVRLAPELNAEQRNAFAAIALHHRPTYVVGAAGVGKTHTVKRSVHALVDEGVRVGICAPTACAAQRASIPRVIGTTLHVLFNIRSARRAASDAPFRLASGERQTEEEEGACAAEEAGSDVTGMYPTAFLTRDTADALSEIQVLMLDEVSMCGVDMIELVDRTLRHVSGRDVPFGGKCLVTCGDFAQLPPVQRTPRADGRSYAFEHASWSHLRPAVIRTVMRQQDAHFASVLGRLRDGRATHTDCDWMWFRSNRDRLTEAPMALFWSNKMTDARNGVFYRRQPGTEHRIRPERGVWVGQQLLNEQEAAAMFGARLKFPQAEDLMLKVGCRVRCTRNVYGPARVLLMANGNTGIVTSIDEGDVYVRLDDHTLSQKMPVVRSSRTQRFKSDGDESVRCVVWFVPLRLCWAATIHTAQGASIAGEVDINPEGFTKHADNGPWVTAPGLAYTAVSRATDIRNVKFLIRPRPAMFVCDERVRAYHDRLFGTRV